MSEGDASPSITQQKCSISEPEKCTGSAIADFGRCLAHLPAERRTAYLAELRHSPGVDLDFTGTTFSQDTLQELLAACGAGASNNGGHINRSLNFTGAIFSGDAVFDRTTFEKTVSFSDARFLKNASFYGAQLQQDTSFDGCEFSGEARFLYTGFHSVGRFEKTIFESPASFSRASFGGYTYFEGAELRDSCDFTYASFKSITFNNVEFTGPADFSNATFDTLSHFQKIRFGGASKFNRVNFKGDFSFRDVHADDYIWFNGSRFHKAESLGPIVCQKWVWASGVIFDEPIVFEVAAPFIWLTRTKLSSTATIWVRYGQVDLSSMVLSAPLEVITSPTPFSTGDQEFTDEGALAVRRQKSARVISISRTDASHLILTDVDLSSCTFAGSYHLDSLRIEGSTNFGHPPTGWHFRSIVPARWSRRPTIREEHNWRASDGRFGPGWADAAPTPKNRPSAEPRTLAVIYRALRKSLEDRGDSPGAAGFYYGEMEMRRHDPATAKPERWLLYLYWLLSGYGLRATRALCALFLIMSITILSLLIFGVPATHPEPTTSGTLGSSGHIVLTTNTPVLAVPRLKDRLTGERLNTAIPIVLEAVVFRASETDLTATGEYIDIAARLLEPSLLALAALAVRGRIKR